MKFGYVIDIRCKFFHKEIQGSISNNGIFIAKKLFLQCLLWFDAHSSACERQKCTKIW